MNTPKRFERGQAVVLVAIAFVVLLGFVALAIDGGTIYAERRQDQNAVDAAALAAAVQKASGAADSTVIDAGKSTLNADNYLDGNSIKRISVSEVKQDGIGRYYLVTATMTTTIQTGFVHLLFSGAVRNTSQAVVRIQPSQPTGGGMALTAMQVQCQNSGSLLHYSGGGNSGYIWVHGGSIWVNAADDNGCAIQPGPSGRGIKTDTGRIYSAGNYNYAGRGNIIPLPVITMGASIPDPLAGLVEPQCTTDSYKDAQGKRWPGNMSANLLTDGTLQRGIYCLDGSIHLSGQSTFSAHNVVLYWKNGGVTLSGQAGFHVEAPTINNCLGERGDPTASCTYAGIAIFYARNNTTSFDLRGNGEGGIFGMVYMLNATMYARGVGSCTCRETDVTGQVIVKNVDNRGNGSLDVTYNENWTYWLPGWVRLEQ